MSSQQIHSVSPSLDRRVVAVATNVGFSLFHSQTFELIFQIDFDNVQYAELVDGSSLVVLVSGQRVILFSLTEKREVACISFDSIPQCVRCNHRRLLVALPEKVLTFELPSLVLLDDHPTGLCPVSFLASSLSGHVALGHIDGEISLFNSYTLERGPSLKAHSHPVSCLAFSPCNKLLASASVKGTVIKTFLLEGDLRWTPLTVFRRGTQSASIRNLCFGGLAAGAGGEGFVLGCAGDSETIHVFQGSRVAAAGASAVKALMPTIAKNFLEAQRAFSVVRLRCVGFENALILEDASLTVVSSAGFAFLYDLRPTECKLKREFSLRLT